MAYQNVGTPRFYINTLEWLASNGAITLPSDHFRTLPVNPTFMAAWSTLTGSSDAMSVPSAVFSQNCFFAALGHTYYTNSVGMNVYVGDSAVEVAWGDTQINVSTPNTEHLAEGADTESTEDDVYGESIPPYDGFSLATLVNQNFDVFVYNAAGECGSVIFGTYYDMPHSPDLNLTMTREYGGIKTIETKGGASLSNSFYTKPPAWGDLGAWEIGGAGEKTTKSGRRIWDLSFSFLDGRDIFGANQSSDTVATPQNPEGYDSDDLKQQDGHFINSILESNNFYSQVIHKTNGGQLPFIFQPDSSNTQVDQFAICKFDQSSFSFQQTAPNLYSVKMKIREVW